MLEKFAKQLNAILSALKTTYSQQGQTDKILLAFLFLFALCCICAIPIGLFSSRTSSTAVPSPVLLPTQGAAATPTALFDFDFPTFTPFPTLPFATALPTLTPLPTETETQTQISPPNATGTPIPIPTLTATHIPATATASAASGGPLTIITVDKPAEYVEIQNRSNAAVDLRGWRLVSETGNQSCTLRGTLQPNEVLRVWARRGEPGFDCRFSFNIWNDNAADPAVLYNPQGEEVSRYP
ncbi:MAG TPA: lamin tail domain-containing protein [Anaerolineales bacterium]|nr:lamin tail domain-containing protein [Anaerolineales bacterium]